jgi:hypothetical protein
MDANPTTTTSAAAWLGQASPDRSSSVERRASARVVDLFKVVFRRVGAAHDAGVQASSLAVGADSPPGDSLDVIGQTVDLDGRRFFWVDGLDRSDPLLVNLADCEQVRYLGSFEQFAKENIGRVAMVLTCAYHQHLEPSPSLVARCVEFMRWRGLTAEQALIEAVAVGTRLRAADCFSALQLGRADFAAA